MAADYSLLGGGFSAANALAALGAGQQRQLQQVQLQRQEEELERQRRLREGLQGAYDPATGQLDRVAARTAYAGAGDVEGAMGVDRQAAGTQAAQYKDILAKVELSAQLLNGVTDEASFQRAKMVAQQRGLDISGIPERYDPQIVATMRAQALSVKDQLAAERDRWVPIGERGLLNVSNPQAVAEYQQSIGRGQPAQQRQAPVRITSPEQAQQLPPGTEFIAPDGSIKRVPGGASPQGGVSFP